MIVVCDVNHGFRYLAIEPLAQIADVLAVVPCDIRTYRKPLAVERSQLDFTKIALPPGWASRTAKISQYLLWKRIQKKVASQNKQISCIIVTSPNYVQLLKQVPQTVRKIYYASDDYRSYDGWSNMELREKEIIELVDHAVFVSKTLARRAIRDYSIHDEKVSVCMNATEERFFPSVQELLPLSFPLGEYRRPVAGVIGGINDRLDFDLLRRCAELPELGTLLLVGPIPAQRSPGLEALLQHPKCVAVGRQPHDEIHRWFQCLDVGLIPYVKTQFNRFCSPMRLYDHLASGAWIVATDACDQVKGFGERVAVCDSPESYVSAVQAAFAWARPTERIKEITWNERARDLLKVIKGVNIA
jgi:hypothetical protein